MKKSVTVFAPATVANVAVGFDILGFSVEGAGDEVTVSALPGAREARVDEISGIETRLPLDPKSNTATVGLSHLIHDLKLSHGFSVKIKKGIPLSSGMGGSAASAVGAVVAANELLDQPLPKEKLLEYALAGEAAASGAIHGDNVGPCLFGGLCLMLPTRPMRQVKIPVPNDVYCVLIHPELKVETRQARSILKPDVSLSKYVEQSGMLSGFLAGCFTGDFDLIQGSMKDVIVEPQRAQLIRGYDELKSKALALGALGFSISGSGPSVFAWVRGWFLAQEIEKEMLAVFSRHRLEAQSWVSPVESPGARVIS